jgi:hypothetical protein
MNRRDFLKGIAGLVAIIPLGQSKSPREIAPTEDESSPTEDRTTDIFQANRSYIEWFCSDGSDRIRAKTMAFPGGMPLHVWLLHIFVNGEPVQVTKMRDGDLRISPSPMCGDMITVEYGASEDVYA